MANAASLESDAKPKRQWLIMVNAVLGALALLAIIVMINYVAAGHFKRFEWERHSPFRLSAKTLKVLRQLTNNVSITIFFDPHGQEDLYNMTSGLLQEYQNANPRFIKVETLDYTRFPGKEAALLDRLRLGALKEKDFVAIEANGRSKIFYGTDLLDYDFDDVISGRSKFVRRKGYKGEMYFTSAIFAVSNPRDLKSYFLYGHGEGDPGDPTGPPRKVGDLGYSKLAAILKDEISSDWARLDLQGSNAIPADCQLLIIGGPHSAQFDTNEVQKIDAYLKQGGRLLLLLDRSSGLKPLMNGWGFDLGQLPVVEQDKQLKIYGDTDFLVAEMAPHPITNPLNRDRAGLLLVQPYPVYPLEKRPGAPEVTPLAASSALSTYGAQKGPFSLICAITQGVVKETRILAVGDPYFLDDQMIDSYAANHYFAGLALNWLLDRPQVMLSDLGPSPIKEYNLKLTATQISQLRWLFLGAMPGSVLFIGGLVWLRRRN